MKPTITQTTDDVVYAWPELGVGLALSHLRETDSGAIKGWIQCESIRPEAPGHVYWAQVTLTTSTDRRTVVSKLDKFSPREPGAWELDIDRCFQDAVQRFFNVPAPDDLADVSSSLDVHHLFDPVLPHGQVTLLLADQGSTKSYLMLYLGACTVTGRASVFGTPSEQGPVLYFDWEVDARVARRRLDWICRGWGIEVPRHLLYVNMSERGRLMDRIREMRQQVNRARARLVIIDSLTFATGGDLNTPEMSAPTMSAIGSLGDGVTKLVSAHPNKASRHASLADISVIGSGLFEFRARAIWLLTREKTRHPNFAVSMTQRKQFDGAVVGPLAYRVVFDNPNRLVRFDGARIMDVPEFAEREMTLAERIRLILRSADDNTGHLAQVLDASPDTVRKTLGRMADVFPLTAGGGRGNNAVWTLREAPEPDGTDGDEEPLPW